MHKVVDSSIPTLSNGRTMLRKGVLELKYMVFQYWEEYSILSKIHVVLAILLSSLCINYTSKSLCH